MAQRLRIVFAVASRLPESKAMAWTGRRSLGAVLSRGTGRGGHAARRRTGNGGGPPNLADSPGRGPHNVAHMAGWSDYALWAQPEDPAPDTHADTPVAILDDPRPEPQPAAAPEEPAEVAQESEASSEDTVPDVDAFDDLEPPWGEEPEPPVACETVGAAEPVETPPDQQVNLELVLDVTVPVRVKIAEVAMTADELLRLGVGAVIELRKPVSQSVDLCVRDTSFARGEVVVVDNNFGLRVTQIGPPASRLGDLGEADEAA